jgi:rubredoxin
MEATTTPKTEPKENTNPYKLPEDFHSMPVTIECPVCHGKFSKEAYNGHTSICSEDI